VVLQSLTGSTTVAAVIGDPIAHSLSPTIHNAGFAALGLDWVYVALPVAAGEAQAAVKAMVTLGIAGMSVTMPHKADAYRSADTATPGAAALGAANCLTLLDDGRIEADNTDGQGFVEALMSDAGIGPKGRSFAVIGAGGAARAVIHAIAAAGAADVAVINRSPEHAAVAAALAGESGRVATIGAVSEADVVINATPLGMGHDPEKPCDPGLICPGQVVIDLIYSPSTTSWMASAQANGAEVHNGLTMLVHQAAVAFTRWTGQTAPVEAMKSAAIAALSGR